MSEPSLDLEDEWDVVNDDGFVYKKRKRKDVSASPIPIKTTTSKHNDEQYIKQRRQTKKAALLNLKEKYEKEIRHWESLSQQLQKTPAYSISSMKESAPSLALPQTQTGNSCKCVLKELLQQVEVQDAFIQDAMILCNLAEMMCHTHEQVLKKSIFDLPVWRPPTTPIHNLLSSDSEDDI
ncbi:hypothetical protein SUGI_0225020 [Cryptomeria japonica]|nr:uncharacterized protein LOC131037316 isoform X2 [Cryptomeria japonica]XP_057825399.1 uncharacterized protein LOC131037316 isoform X2 [Cryptomeria japonica]XP_059074133.1 uncharacterized protein LOC131037316 isoform X2 [Cryptomeria japonica]GLJ14062.1 hypothetical protein SUGI_0225020 [Cryptomeria japonica]